MSDIANGSIEEILAAGKAVRIKPQGYSMYPVIVPGRDEAVVQACDTAHIKRGDVVLYRRDSGILVIHRVWKHTADGFFMVGDNQTAVEGPLPPSYIKGVMVQLIRNGRYISVHSPAYRLLCGIWLGLRPVRRPISLAVAAVRRTLRRNGDLHDKET